MIWTSMERDGSNEFVPNLCQKVSEGKTLEEQLLKLEQKRRVF